MKVMAESKHYSIISEYETVFLKIKKTAKMIFIGDFYGDPETAIISEEETYCIIGGEGIIIYYLKEPFEPYKNIPSKQWKTWGRDNKNHMVWIHHIIQLDHKHVMIETADAQKIIFNMD